MITKIRRINAIWTIILFVTLSLSVNSQKNNIVSPAEINVESSLKNLSRLKVSDLGKTIRYIPLETPDDGLIGKNPVVKVLKKYIVVEYGSLPSRNACLLFSKEDGRFIAEIGHAGQDPAAYTDCFSWADEKEEFLYFERKPNQLIKYDMKGNFCGKVEFPSSGLASYYLITDSEIIGYFDAFTLSNPRSLNTYSLVIFKKDGSLKDTIPSFYPYTLPFTDDLFEISLIHGNTFYNSYGSWVRAGAFIF
ncbi:MAG: DUF4934 domain-containing protein, partial [Tannerellaceae bacterium]|nr:DUF4934 domain-containing protein [Tannerellaceae bacterium]